jgi:hypothetical protein
VDTAEEAMVKGGCGLSIRNGWPFDGKGLGGVTGMEAHLGIEFCGGQQQGCQSQKQDGSFHIISRILLL